MKALQFKFSTLLFLIVLQVYSMPVVQAGSKLSPEALELREKYRKILSVAEKEKNKTIQERDKLLAEKERLDKSQDQLETVGKEAKEKANELLKEEVKSGFPNPKSAKSMIKWGSGKVTRGKKTMDEMKRMLEAYYDAVDFEMDEMSRVNNGKTDLESQIEIAQKRVVATEQDYESIKSWGAIIDPKKSKALEPKPVVVPTSILKPVSSFKPPAYRPPLRNDGHRRDFDFERRDLIDKMDRGVPIDGDRFDRAREILDTTG